MTPNQITEARQIAEALDADLPKVGEPEAHFATLDVCDIRRAAALLRALADEAERAEPVAWRCKGFVDGWILFDVQEQAERFHRDTHCTMQALYTHPTPDAEQYAAMKEGE